MSQYLGYIVRILAFAVLSAFVLPHLSGIAFTGGLLGALLSGVLLTLFWKGAECLNQYVLHTDSRLGVGKPLEWLVNLVFYALALGVGTHLPVLGLAVSTGFLPMMLGGLVLLVLDKLLLDPTAEHLSKSLK